MAQLRIAIRESATELTREQTDQVAGGRRQFTTDDGVTCSVDWTTDCWVTGGAMVSNDD